jgi:hypothetical protein
VAGAAPGKVANKAGIRIKPPPPTIASIIPASKEASETISNSMGAIVAVLWLSPAGGQRGKKKRRLRDALKKITPRWMLSMLEF